MDSRCTIVLMLLLTACSPTTTPRLTTSVTPKIVNAEVDRLERAYILWSDNRLSVKSPVNVPDYVYANNRRGRISDVDVSNPLKIIVYYKDYMELQVLDNTLSEITSLSLDQLAYDDVRTVASSNDNNIWIYDAARYQLIKIDDKGTELLSSINLTELRLNSLNPSDIKEGGNKVYVVDPRIGIVVFDNLGQYINTLPIKGVTEVYVDNATLIYALGNRLRAYDQRLLEDITINLPEVSDSTYFKIIPGPTRYTMVYPDTIIQIPR